VATIDLSAYSSVPTLTVTVGYQPTYYQQYTNVLLGSQCGRTYVYTLAIIGSKSGGCGSITVRTLQCDNATPYGSVPVSVRLTGSGVLVASGTTNATTGVYTFTGITTGVNYTVVGTSSRGELVVSGSFTLTCNEDVRLRYSATYPPACASPNYTITATSGTVTDLTCCSDCDPITIPKKLTLIDPGVPNYFIVVGNTTIISCGTSSGSIPLEINTYTGGPYIPGCSMWFGNDFNRYSNGYSAYELACTGSGVVLSVSQGVRCGYRISSTRTCLVIKPGGGGGGQTVNYGGPISPASLTCSPFSATFNVPSVTLTMYDEWFEWPPGVFHSDPCGSYTIPARTITITE
jgi:hypothetical protein